MVLIKTNMATWPSGKAKVCNTYITSSNLVVASQEGITATWFLFCIWQISIQNEGKEYEA